MRDKASMLKYNKSGNKVTQMRFWKSDLITWGSIIIHFF